CLIRRLLRLRGRTFRRFGFRGWNLRGAGDDRGEARGLPWLHLIEDGAGDSRVELREHRSGGLRVHQDELRRRRIRRHAAIATDDLRGGLLREPVTPRHPFLELRGLLPRRLDPLVELLSDLSERLRFPCEA